MRGRYSRYRRRPTTGGNTSGHTIFGSTGWLFADLLLALALAFLLATTFGVTPTPSAGGRPPQPTASATVSPAPKPSPAQQPEPALDLKYVTVPLTIDPNDISASSIDHVIENDSKLLGRRAGLVILFTGGDPYGTQWEAADTQVWSILQGMDQETPLFKGAVPLKYWNASVPVTEVELHVYLFKPNS